MFPLPNATAGIGQLFPYLNLVSNNMFGIFMSAAFVGVLYFSFSRYMKERALLASTFVGLIVNGLLWAMGLTNIGVVMIMFVAMVVSFIFTMRSNN
jgi:hypothetical protein